MQKFYDCGIDLGTTNSCIAVPTDDNSYIIVENTQDRMQVTPSAIAIDKRGRQIAGQRAINTLDVQNLAIQFKRWMGTENVKEFKDAGVTMTPEQLSSEILKILKSDAESRMSKDMNDVVITVPAAFSSLQCEATNQAAKLAGFRNVILLQEPIAASVAYGAKPDAAGQYWMVFDYGGGTLDVAILSTHDGRLTVINSEGDNYCGGSDINQMMYDKIVKPKLEELYDISNFDQSIERKIVLDLERCKIQLSSTDTSIIEIFDIDDNNGTPIEFEYEITRDELEGLIENTIDKCMDIAKKAVEGAINREKISQDQISKIMLVGGSTFIPMVRRKLQETFSGIELDCTINPMTVVAAGAAIYAATSTAEVELKDENIDKTIPEIKIQYEPITSENTVNLVGTIENLNGIAIHQIKIDSTNAEDGSGAIWTSGWVELLDSESGLFDVDLHIKSNSSNNFVIYARDTVGKEIELNNNRFTIKHKENVLKTSNPPATFSVSVMATDGQNNILKPLINKNTPLPAEGTSTFTLNKTLDPSIEDTIEIHVWEGETFENPEANNPIGTVTVQSSAMPHIVPEGTVIELTIRQDESRTNHITGYIPDADYYIEEKTLRDDKERISLMNRMDSISDKFAQIEVTIDELDEKGIDLNGLDDEYEEIKEQFDEMYDLIGVNDDKVQLYINEFYDIHTRIINLERSTQETIKKQEDSEKLESITDIVSNYGEQPIQQEFREAKKAYNEATDDENRDFYMQKMENMRFEVMTNNFNWLANTLMNIASDNSIRYTDAQKAEYWKSEGRDAIQRNDKIQLKNAVFGLLGLMVNSANGSINSVIADLRL